ncbi:hypothetical protein Tco_0583422 [Tanacetum coccineum]
MEGSWSNATKESLNEDNPLSEMVINVEYPSTLATKEQPQVDSLTKVVPQTVPKAIDDSLVLQSIFLNFEALVRSIGKEGNNEKSSLFVSRFLLPTPAPSATPASLDRPVSPTRLPEPSEDAMPYGRMRGGLQGKMLEGARLELHAPTKTTG